VLTSLALEEISLNAWPALQTILYDGWVLRFAEGYTRRANSISPLYPSSLPLGAKLDTCARLYGERGLPVIFKLSQGASPPGLDAALADRGYREDARTAVQILNLERAARHPAPDVHVAASLTVEWLDAYARMSNLPDLNRGILPRILTNIVPAHTYASLATGGRVVATGLGVAQSGCVGLYDIVTDPACRGRGFGGQIVQSLLAWGKTQGAEVAYLQVMLDNLPALRLYARLGFTEFYRYWYRVRSL
jgi:GNAT superfamily N-acetyltransferase